MSDPLAVSFLSKINSYYQLNGDLLDSHGSNPLVAGVSVSGYEAGRFGQRMKSNSRASCVLSQPITYNSGAMTIGSLMTFTAPINITEMSLSTTDAQRFQLLGLDAAFDNWRAGSYLFNAATADDANRVEDPRALALAYPITVQVQDSHGTIAQSEQTIRISDALGALLPGDYFIAATWLNGIVSLYVDGHLAAQSDAPQASIRGNTILRYMIGNTIDGVGCGGAHEGAFMSYTAALSAAEILWLYNAGAYRSYAQIVALAA